MVLPGYGFWRFHSGKKGTRTPKQPQQIHQISIGYPPPPPPPAASPAAAASPAQQQQQHHQRSSSSRERGEERGGAAAASKTFSSSLSSFSRSSIEGPVFCLLVPRSLIFTSFNLADLSAIDHQIQEKNRKEKVAKGFTLKPCPLRSPPVSVPFQYILE